MLAIFGPRDGRRIEQFCNTAQIGEQFGVRDGLTRNTRDKKCSVVHRVPLFEAERLAHN
jgi:hypothetical protein